MSTLPSARAGLANHRLSQSPGRARMAGWHRPPQLSLQVAVKLDVNAMQQQQQGVRRRTCSLVSLRPGLNPIRLGGRTCFLVQGCCHLGVGEQQHGVPSQQDLSHLQRHVHLGDMGRAAAAARRPTVGRTRRCLCQPTAYMPARSSCSRYAWPHNACSDAGTRASRNRGAAQHCQSAGHSTTSLCPPAYPCPLSAARQRPLAPADGRRRRRRARPPPGETCLQTAPPCARQG